MRLLTAFFIAILSAQAAFAQTITQPVVQTVADKEPDFSVKKATQQFDRINLDLSLNHDFEHLSAAIKTITLLRDQAESCIQDTQKRLTNLDSLIKQGSSTVGPTDKQGADLVYLDNEKKKLADKQSQCRLFSIRSKEALDAYKSALETRKQQATFSRGMPLWQTLPQLLDLNHLFETPTTSLFKLPNSLQSTWFWFTLTIASWITATIILLLLPRQKLVRRYFITTTRHPWLRHRLANLHLVRKRQSISKMILHWQWSLFIPLVFCLASGALELIVLWQNDSLANNIISLSNYIFLYSGSLLVVLCFFKARALGFLFDWYSLGTHWFQTLAVSVLTLYSTAQLSTFLLHQLHANELMIRLCHSLLFIATLLIVNTLIHAFCRQHQHFKWIQKYQTWCSILSTTFCLSFILLDVLGYPALALHISRSAIETTAVIFLTTIIWDSISRSYRALYDYFPIKKNIVYYFGYKSEETFTEFLILKTTLQVTILFISIFQIIKSWTFADYYLDIIYTQFFHGLTLGNTTIHPGKIVLGILVYCILYLLFLSISTRISRHQQFDGEEETQVAVASILSYLGFALALISALLIAGFDFTGLAIIAGALSVGIGLGLQSIVNNFVSGLILLIEKPIKPGDRIAVDGVEGFVKKIRVRSTQIITPASEDIIIPNSDLITRRVTNYMYSDKYYRVQCDVGVSYESDTQLVRDLLLQIGNNHDEVLKYGRNKPVVLFSSFGENALLFSLFCTIKDVNKKGSVQSELNLNIIEQFRQNNIAFGLPKQ